MRTVTTAIRYCLLTVLFMTGISVRADDQAFELDIPAGTVDVALKALAEQTEFLTLFQSNDVDQVRTQGIKGPFTIEEALAHILADTPLAFDLIKRGVIVVRPSNTSASIRPKESLTGSKTMQNKQSFFKRATALLAAAMLAPATGAAETQAADEEVMEEIVVTGIRGSMHQSLERKRNADHFVDAITAEDIGAFPDQNLAESLQRISGVAIDRKSGEGAFVSVRGLGPQFVQTTIHGRVAVSNNAPGSFDGAGNTNTKSRAVSFSAFQSGLVQAVEVHKSPRADHVEGGLGGFIDVQPRRPLDIGKRQAALSVDATRNELSDDTAPGVFAMYSDVLTDNLGFMVSAQWDNRFLRSDSMNQFGFLGDPRTTTVNGVDLTGYYPARVNGDLHYIDRDRLNLSSALQWQPSDRVDMTFDALFTDNESDETITLQGWAIGNGHQGITDATVIDDNGTGIFTMISTTRGLLQTEVGREQTDAEALNLGLNLKFQATDNLAINVDASISDTEAPITLQSARVRNRATQMTYLKNGSGRLPSITTTAPALDVDHYTVLVHKATTYLVDDRQSQFRVDATYEFDGDWLDSIQAGVRTYRADRRDRARYLNSRAFINQPMADFGGGIAFPEDDFLSGLGMILPPTTLPNLDALMETFITRPDDILNGGGFNTGTERSLAGFQGGRYTEDLNHDDDGNAVYAMVTFSGEFGDTPYSGNVGVRYVDNSTGSVGQIQQPIDIDYSDAANPEIILSAPEFVDIGHEYTETLPSLNLRFDPRDDVVVRVALAKVFSRPRFLDLNPRQTVQPRPRTTRGGNGKLDPTTAVQFDLAVEWYFADYSVASVGLFVKDIEAFVQSQPNPTPFPGVTDPETLLPLVLTDFRPLNSGSSDLVGVEFAFQRTFEDLLPAPFDGLGVIANYTYIDSGSDFKNEKTGASYSVPGLSENTINFTLFYEKGPWTGRVSYNFRDDFLDDINGGFSGHPFFVDAYEQWDASFGYKLNDNLSFMLEAINMTDEDVYYYNLLGTGTQEHISSAIHTGRRFQAGVRWKL